MTDLYCCHWLNGALDYARLYTVVESNDSVTTVLKPTGGKKKYPNYCFSKERPPVIERISLDYFDEETGLAEADVFLETGEWRLIIIGTPARLAERLSRESYLAIPNLLILPNLDEEAARKAIHHLCKEGQLLDLSVTVTRDVHDP